MKNTLKSRRLPNVFLSLAALTLLLGSFQNCGQFAAVQIDPSLVNSSGFSEARKVLMDNCLGCHNANSASGSVALNSEAEFVLSGWISPQNPSSSKLITRLKNYPLKDGSQNMPSGVATLTDAEYRTLVSWVENVPTSVADLNCSVNESISEAQIKRLTKNQFINSLTNAFGNIFASTDYPDFRDDNPRIGLADNPNLMEINEVNFESLHESSDKLVAKIISGTSAVQSCINGSGTTCFTTLIDQYGRLLWRRPLTTTERNGLTAKFAEITSGGLPRTALAQFVFKSLILSVNHLFRTEVGSGGSGGIFDLTQYEVASFLSFAAWDSPPDSTLMTLAEQGRLHDLSVLKQQVARLTADAKYNSKLALFMMDLLKIQDVLTGEKDPSFNLTSTERRALYDSAFATVQDSYNQTNSSLFTPFSVNRFHLNSTMSRFISGSTSAQLTSTPVNTSQRYGILSHPAFLTSMSSPLSSGIVKRGVFTLEQLLCEHLPPAPAEITPDPNPPASFNPATSSSREVLTVTHSSQPACIGCHVKIDPPGFALESYDNFGRFRTTEKGGVAIDSSGELRGIDPTPITFSNSVTFFRELEKSPRFKSCINDKFFEYITGFTEINDQQRCEKENFKKKLAAKPERTNSLLDALIELPSFVRRRPASNSR